MARRGHTLGGWDSLLCLHSLCQARWLLSLREEVERWKRGGKKRGKEGSSESPLTAPKWPVPRATTSGDHLQLAHAASSFFVLFPLANAHFLTLFLDMGGGGGGGSGVVFGQAVICAHISGTLVCLCYKQSGRWGRSVCE